MKIGIGSDHRGAGYKKLIIDILKQNNHKVVDYGADNKRVDYSDIACRVAFAVTCKDIERAVLIGSIGSEMALTANKINGIRAVACFDDFHTRLAREKLDCNVLCLAGELTSEPLLDRIVRVWLATEPAKGRYIRRLSKIDAIEQALNCSRL